MIRSDAVARILRATRQLHPGNEANIEHLPGHPLFAGAAPGTSAFRPRLRNRRP
jgi:hypothetical protein